MRVEWGGWKCSEYLKGEILFMWDVFRLFIYKDVKMEVCVGGSLV